MTAKRKVVVVFSGGQDSTTCLYYAVAQGYEIHAVTFDYGQRHWREIEAAKKIARMAGCASHEIVHLGKNILKGSSPLLVSGNELEEYESHEVLPGGLEKTFVPMRNQLFLTIAANRAYVIGTNHIITGVCEEDYGGYPDCRRGFINKFEDASSAGTFTGETGTMPSLFVHTPLMRMSKAGAVDWAVDLPGCYEALAFSHTSYAGEYPPSSKDHASLLRAKGFEQAGVPDPLILRAYMEGAIGKLPETMNYYPTVVGYYMDMLKEVVNVSD